MLPPPPRDIRLKTSTWWLRIFLWVAVLGVFVVCPILMFRSLDRIHALMSTGKTIDAFVVDSHQTHGKRSGYFLRVSFRANGQEFGGDRSVSWWAYYNYKDKQTVPVVVMPNDPSDFEVVGVDENTVSNTQRGWLAMIGMFGLIVGGFFIWLEISLWNEQNLLSRGESVMGEVVAVKVIKGKSTSTVVRYRYPTQYADRNGKASASGNIASRVPEGEPILVLYSRDNDKRSLPYPLFQYTELIVPHLG